MRLPSAYQKWIGAFAAAIAGAFAAAIIAMGICVTQACATPSYEAGGAIGTQSTTYSIVYKLNGGTQASNQVASIKKGKSIRVSKLKKPTRSHFKFAGWYANKALTKKATKLKGVSNVAKRTVHAKWKRTSYGIIYSMGGGIFSGAYPTSIAVGKTLSASKLSRPVRNGYTFKGWYVDRALKTKPKKLSGVADSAKRTVYAKWEPNTYSITYEANGGSLPSSAQKSYQSSEGASTLPAPSRAGYSFIGWYADADLTTLVTGIPANAYGDKKLYARWEERVMIAHRGYCSGGATANSLEAFHAAADKGFTRVDALIGFSADGTAMVGDAEFEAFLAVCEERGLVPYIELPACTKAQAESLVSAVDSHNMGNEAHWMSSSGDVLAFVQAVHPRSSFVVLAPSVSDSSIRTANVLEARGGSATIGVPADHGDTRVVSKCREAGIRLGIWTISSESLASAYDQFVSAFAVTS